MIRKLDYFYASIKDESGEGFRFLDQLASRQVDLLALTAVPFGPGRAQITLFPTNAASLLSAAKHEKIALDGPHSAILVQGEDQVGAFASVLAKLAATHVNVFSVQGMTDGRGGFGYIVYVRPSDIDRALKALGAS
jgi:ACT domain-containing protein